VDHELASKGLSTLVFETG